MTSPETLAQRQLEAYNAHDLDAFCACFADDVTVELLVEGEEMFQGMTAFRARYTERFRHPDLHARLVNRIACGRVVVDEEEVTGLPDSPLHVIAIYEVADGLIRKVRFEQSV